MGKFVWNGTELVPRAQASVDVEDRGHTFGDGIYEVFRVYGGRVFEPELHWARFERSAMELRIELPYAREAFERGVEQLLQAEGLDAGIVYLQLTRGTAPRAHPFPAEARPTVTAFTKPLARPTAALEAGTAIVTRPDIRWLRCDIKSLNLLPNVLAKQEASEAGASEAVLHRDGIVTEGSSTNIAIVKDGVVRTHPANHLILHGVTRAVALRLAGGIDIPVREETFTLEELREADEAFLLSTTVEIMPIVAIDGEPVGDGVPGPITRKLQAAFEKLI
jgi:D-alanine transaminase